VIDSHDMACQELVEALTEYLDGALGAHDRARLEAHLAACDDCGAYLVQFKATIALADRADGAKLPPDLRNDLIKTFRAHDFRA
jgi:anti-sigma factor (TIGR02949 family)